MKTIIVISDASGETAERIVRAALLQFTDVPVNVRTYARVRLESEVEKLVARAAELDALLVFTVVHSESRDQILQLVEQHNVKAVDLMGTLITKLTAFLSSKPRGVPGMLHVMGKDYFRRIEAVEFAVKNDDGAEPRNLPKADLVLVGISRTSKTPLSMYLAQKGFKVANVPLVLGVPPPKQLDEVADSKVYGLIIQSMSLMRIRQARLKHLGMPEDTSYGTRNHIDREIEYSRSIFREHADWPVIDVTSRAIEETAADILRLHYDRNG